MKNQALFSSKDKCKKLKCRLLQFLFGALRVNHIYNYIIQHITNHTTLGSQYLKVKVHLKHKYFKVNFLGHF